MNFNTFVLLVEVRPLIRLLPTHDVACAPGFGNILLFAPAIKGHGFPVAAVWMDARLGFAKAFENGQGEGKGGIAFLEHGVPHWSICESAGFRNGFGILVVAWDQLDYLSLELVIFCHFFKILEALEVRRTYA